MHDSEHSEGQGVGLSRASSVSIPCENDPIRGGYGRNGPSGRFSDAPVLSSARVAVYLRSWRGRSRSEPIDAAQDVGKQVSRDRDLGKLESDVAPMAYDLRADSDQFLPQCGQRPMFDSLGQSECAQEVAEIVGQCVKLKTDGVVAELAA